MDLRKLTIILQDYTSATHRFLRTWSEVPMLMMSEVDWRRGPFVIVGESDRMMWPLLPPGSLLRLDQTQRSVADGQWGEFERPIYLIEWKGRFRCCHAQRRANMLRLIPHLESPERTSTSVPYKDVKVHGQLTPIFRPLATRGNAAGRPEYLFRLRSRGSVRR